MFKKPIIVYIFTCITIPLIFIFWLFIYDPMQVFHKSYFQKELHLHWNMRQQAAGIIKNFKFDSIVLGTSMLENTSANEASKKIGGKFVNVSLSGSNFSERSYPLRYALKNKELKTVIYSLDSVYIGQNIERKDFPLSTFDYLYDRNLFNDLNVYLNKKFLKCALKLSNKNKCIGRISSLDRPNAWYQSKGHSVRFGGLDKWFKAKNNNQIKGAFSSIVNTSEKIRKGEVIAIGKDIAERKQKAEKYLDEFVLSYVEKYPETKFILVFPPYSRMRFAQWAQQNLPTWEIHKHIVKYLALKSSDFANLEIYGYEDQDFLDDIANYKDLGHYHYSINSKMLDNFQKQQHLLTSKNIESYLEEAEKRAKNYNVFEISDAIKAFLEKNP